MRTAWLLLGCVACGGGGGADGRSEASSRGEPTAAPAPSASAPDRRGRVDDAAWSDVERWIAQREVCWAAPIANLRALVTRCGGGEYRTVLPKPDSLKKAVDAADPKHDTIGFTMHYEAYRELPWESAAALFPTGTVYEVEVNQNLRAMMTTVADGTVNARYATVVASANELKRLAKEAPRPLVVKVFWVEEVPWKRALEVFASGRVTHAGRVHVQRVFMTDQEGHEYLTIPPSDDALRDVDAVAPHVPWTVE